MLAFKPARQGSTDRLPATRVHSGAGLPTGALQKRDPFMSTHHEFYLERAAAARRDAESATLVNVRDRSLRAAAAWDEMATRAARTGRLRAETEARKATELAE